LVYVIHWLYLCVWWMMCSIPRWINCNSVLRWYIKILTIPRKSILTIYECVEDTKETCFLGQLYKMWVFQIILGVHRVCDWWRKNKIYHVNMEAIINVQLLPMLLNKIIFQRILVPLEVHTIIFECNHTTPCHNK